MRFARILAVLVLATAGTTGCAAPDDAGPQGFVSGGRLRARLDDAGGGARIFRGWFDSQTGEVCRFRLAADGTWRCLPDGLLSAAAVWLDAACTQRGAVVFRPECGQPRYVLERAASSAACDPEPAFDVLRVGDERTDVATAYARNERGECVAWSTPAGARLHDVRLEPLASFVAATSRLADRGGQLALRVVDAQDGTRDVLGMYDRDTGARCTPWPDGDVVRCAPSIAAIVSGAFADASCTTRIASAAFSGSCAAPRFAFAYGTTCGDRTRWYTVGAPVAGDAAFADVNGTCSPASVSPPPLFTVGTEIDPATFPLLRYETAGSGRVRVRRVVTSDGRVVATDRFEDAQTGAPCAVFEMSDGSHRCVSTGGSGVGVPASDSFFFDAACTEPVVFAADATSGCGFTVPSVVIRPDPAATTVCASAAPRVRVYEPGAPRANAPLYARNEAGGCEPSSVSSDGAHALGAELGPEMFPRIDTRTE